MEGNIRERLDDAARLRDSILHYALTGQLLSQDPGEGSTQDVLAAIADNPTARKPAKERARKTRRRVPLGRKS
jgi:hypothetical protein